MTNKPFSESCEQNKEPILSVIKQWFNQPDATLLEIGSGTGQHASYFPQFLDKLFWQPSDIAENQHSIKAWCSHAQLSNVHPPLILNVSQNEWPIESYDYVFSANTVHIMAWNEVKAMFAGIRKVLKLKGIFCLYGPFNYNSQCTSLSNAQFDQWLKSRNPNSGIRDFEALCELGESGSQHRPLKLLMDHEMPANNRILVFQSIAPK
ncbi:hypothetical protein MNBD_GAMMA23-467 [hydrothermal vent metagenome]|uniref:SAM-dependent methyltransferase n=1 Tax=hydrothermal vent metagenome TaxID=652676 RepID=A0A3B0ZNV1_9ZZZZ